MSTIIQLAIVLGIMVLVHEFGHFAVAKLCGIRVEVFSIGFGKRLFGFKRGDTDYQIAAIPLGGYVKMAGDTPGETPSGDPGEFNAHPRWQRILVALAGTIENPTWEDVFNRSLLNLNQTISFSYVHDGQRTDSKLFVDSKGGPDDFT